MKVVINGISYFIDLEIHEATLLPYDDNMNYSGDIIIPEFINYDGELYPVTTIHEFAFCVCDKLTSVIIPRTVLKIERFAFSYCSSLRSIIIPKEVTNIGEVIMDSCHNLESIIVEEGNKIYDSRNECNAIIETSTNTLIQGCKSTIIPNDVVKIADCSFESQINLESIFIPQGVEVIGDGAFSECYNLKSIHIPEGVIHIGEGAFELCNKLESLFIPSTVTHISERAFYGCNSLKTIEVDPENKYYDSRECCNTLIETSINKLIKGCINSFIPNTIEIIGTEAFHECYGPPFIIIPQSVKRIESDAFSVSSILDYYFYSSIPPKVEFDSFAGITPNITLYVPKESLEVYKKAFFHDWDSIILPYDIESNNILI